MGLRANLGTASDVEFVRSLSAPSAVEDQIAQRFFFNGKESWGPHTIPYLPNNAALTYAAHKAENARIFSQLFPTNSGATLHLEENLLTDVLYARMGITLIEDLSPDNWVDFSYNFTFKLLHDVNCRVAAMKHSMRYRRPTIDEKVRASEYEILHEVIDSGNLADISQAADKHLASDEAREYALNAIEAALLRNYPYQREIASIQLRLLRSAPRGEKVPSSVIMMYAFVLSKLENHDIFSAYSFLNSELNLVPVGWDFDD